MTKSLANLLMLFNTCLIFFSPFEPYPQRIQDQFSSNSTVAIYVGVVAVIIIALLRQTCGPLLMHFVYSLYNKRTKNFTCICLLILSLHLEKHFKPLADTEK